jgi:hypothetical protein
MKGTLVRIRTWKDINALKKRAAQLMKDAAGNPLHRQVEIIYGLVPEKLRGHYGMRTIPPIPIPGLRFSADRENIAGLLLQKEGQVMVAVRQETSRYQPYEILSPDDYLDRITDAGQTLNTASENLASLVQALDKLLPASAPIETLESRRLSPVSPKHSA